eukprot:314033-Alexandrium_andersonii.AAC.1
MGLESRLTPAGSGTPQPGALVDSRLVSVRGSTSQLLRCLPRLGGNSTPTSARDSVGTSRCGI